MKTPKRTTRLPAPTKQMNVKNKENATISLGFV